MNKHPSLCEHSNKGSNLNEPSTGKQKKGENSVVSPPSHASTTTTLTFRVAKSFLYYQLCCLIIPSHLRSESVCSILGNTKNSISSVVTGLILTRSLFFSGQHHCQRRLSCGLLLSSIALPPPPWKGKCSVLSYHDITPS